MVACRHAFLFLNDALCDDSAFRVKHNEANGSMYITDIQSHIRHFISILSQEKLAVKIVDFNFPDALAFDDNVIVSGVRINLEIAFWGSDNPLIQIIMCNFAIRN